MGEDVAGETIFIAGAGGGMGRAIAIAAAQAGADLILLGRSADGLAKTAATAGRAKLSIVADASDAAALATALKPHATLLEKVDVLVNAIGTNIVERSFDRLTPQSWAAMLDANLTAAFNLSQLVLPSMRVNRKGLIVHISSTAARKPDLSGAAYQASKAGVMALTHAIMEEEWANGIRATSILPGMTNTPLLDRRPVPVSPEARAAALQPEDIAAACMFVMQLPARAHVSEIHLQPSRR
jgi:NADP-dependent 3-hydroxy acid dehydrogenase YdfG